MRIKKSIHIFISLLVGIGPFISFCNAQETEVCKACGNTPEKVILINNFIRDMLINIKSIGTEAPYLGKAVPPSRFDSGKFVAPKQSSLSKSIRRARELLGSALAVERINKNIFNGSNTQASLQALSSNKELLRDRNKVLKIEKDISKKKFELSVGGGWTDKIGGKTLENMEKTISKYKDLKILGDLSTIDGGAEYGDLILLLEKLNNATKKLILLGGEEMTKEDKEELFDARTSGEITLMIEASAITEIKTNYDCLQQYRCEQNRKESKNDLKELVKAFKNGLKNARDDVKRANANLAKAYSKENIQKTFKEQTLVTQISGAIHDLKSWRKEAKASKTKETKEDIKKAEEEGLKAKQYTETIQTSDNKDENIKLFQARIEKTQNSIKTTTSDMMKTYALQDTPDIGAYFVGLSQLINSINDNIVGNKDSDKKCLIKNLGALCEAQCSNINNKKCYY